MSAETQKDGADQPPQTPVAKQEAELRVAVDQPDNGAVLMRAQARIDQAIAKISAEDSSLPEITPEMRKKVEKITLEMQVLSRQAAELQREIMPHPTDKMQELSRVMLSDTQIATIERAVQESVE